MLINKVVMAEVVLCVDGVMVDVTVSNDVATAPPAAASPVVKAEEVSMINRSIVLTTGVLVVLVLAMDAVAIEVNKMWADMAPTAHALDVSSMLLRGCVLGTRRRDAAGRRADADGARAQPDARG